MLREVFVLLCLFVLQVLSQPGTLGPPTCTPANLLPYSHIETGYCPTVWASSLRGPRQVTVASNGDVLVLESSANSITVLWDDNHNGYSDPSERATLATYTNLNHAVVIEGAYVYASNPVQVVRWPYTAGDRSNLGTPEVVIHSIPCCHHVTRTIRFDSSGLIYVQVGSASNEDPDTTHARINRFNISTIPQGGINWNTGYVFANGLRNEVGLRFDALDRLWGVENGVDNLYRSDLGGDISNGNPAEELNYFGTPDDGGLFFGYPYCWSSFNLTGYHPGTQFVMNSFEGVPPYSDAWCQDTSNVVPPALSMDSHMAPLDIFFWYSGAFPTVKRGDAFVTLHGSWDKQPPDGYRVDVVAFDTTTGMPIMNYPFLKYQGPGAYSSSQWIRPVGLALYVDVNGVDSLFVTSDASGQLILIYPNPTD